MDKIDWYCLSHNLNATELIEANINPENIDWEWMGYIYENPNIINLIKENKEKINWGYLCFSSNAIEFLKEHKEKIRWESLSHNPIAIELLKDNKEKINPFWLSMNPSIFIYDYDNIKETNKKINKELIEWYYHPSRINEWIDELDV